VTFYTENVNYNNDVMGCDVTRTGEEDSGGHAGEDEEEEGEDFEVASHH
jgi:hypothetical protein